MADQDQTNPQPTAPPEPVVLRYVGDGAYIPGVPRVNLTARDIALCGYTETQLKAFHNGAQPLYVDAIEAVGDIPDHRAPLSNDDTSEEA